MSSKKKPSADALLAKAASAASYTIALQIVFRLLNFAINAILLRYVEKDVIGLANVRLALLYTTVVFFAREAVRKACLEVGSATRQQRVNLSWVSTLLGMVLATFLLWSWVTLLEVPTDPKMGHSSYHTSASLFALAAVLELLSEPLWIYAKTGLYVRLQAFAEGAAIGFRALVLISLILGSSHYPSLVPISQIVAFGMAQAAYGGALCLIYAAALGSEIARDRAEGLTRLGDLLPRQPVPGVVPWISVAQRDVMLAFSKQAVLQQLLSNGERYLMTLFSAISLSDQGHYDIIHNLGSLAARLVFRPLEEAFYMFLRQLWSAVLVSVPTTTTALRAYLRIVPLSWLTRLERCCG